MVDAVIRQIAPDVATAVLQLKVGPFTPPDGILRLESDDRLSLVLTRRSGRWHIAHGHNTVIDAGAQRFDPVKTGWPEAPADRKVSAKSRPTRKMQRPVLSSVAAILARPTG